MTNKRWKCPKCEGGINAPSRLAKLDVRRWCLSCSAEGRKLVERLCVALERKRAIKKEQISVRNKKRTATRRASRNRKFQGAVEQAAMEAFGVDNFGEKTLKDIENAVNKVVKKSLRKG